MNDNTTQISDGFGDHLTPDELIERHERLAYKIANERLASMPGDIEDAVQEARITLWQTYVKKPDSSTQYLNGAMRNRISDYARTPKPTGAASVQGKRQLRPGEGVTLDNPDSPVYLIGAELLEGVLMAYHEGEILRAIDSLPRLQSRYIIMRFWGGMTNVEITARLALTASQTDELWRQARPKLKQALSHLVSAV